MEIRKAELEDVPLMAKMGRYFHDISSYGKLMAYDELRIQDNLIGIINSPNAILLVAWLKGEFAGMLAGVLVNNLYDPRELIAQCLFVAVLPDFQKKKVANKLMGEFEAWGLAKGATLLTHSGYSEKFIEAMKKRGYEQVEVVLMKRIEEPSEVSV